MPLMKKNEEPYFLGISFFAMILVAHFRNWPIFFSVLIILFCFFYYLGKNNEDKNFIFRFLVLAPFLWFGLVMRLPEAVVIYFHEVFVEHLWIGLLTIVVAGIVFYNRYQRLMSVINCFLVILFFWFLTVSGIGVVLAVHEYGLFCPR